MVANYGAIKEVSAYMAKAHTLPDTHQSSLQLAVIQLTGIISLPVLASSVLIRHLTNFTDAVVTVVLANVILWVIRYGIISMSYKGRKSALDIAQDYLGNIGGYFIGALLLASTLAWFIVETTLASNVLTQLIPLNTGEGVNRFIQTSVVLGILSTLFCMEGIVVLRLLAVFSFPILILVFIGVLFTSPLQTISSETVGISLMGLSIALGTSLGITVDLPTFFRHSRSWKTSINALTIIQLVSLAISIAGLFLGPVISPWLESQEGINFAASSTAQKIFIIILIFVSVVCANVSNVYSSSVGWEIIAPIFAGRKEYLILGLGLTTIYILVANIFSMHSLLDTTDNALVNLCLVLVLAYVLSLLFRRSPSSLEKGTYFFAWLISTTLNILQFCGIMTTKYPPILIGVLAILAVVILGLSVSNVLKRSFVKLTSP